MKYTKKSFKFIGLIILTVIIIGIVIIATKGIYAADPKYEDNGVIYTLSKTTLKITGTGKVTDVWKNRSELGTSLPTTITAVTIAKTITEIDISAFEGCSTLKTVTFASGSTCTKIGNKAFKGCSALTNIVNANTANTLPASITTIGNEAFSGCTSLTKLNLNTGVTTVGTNAFQGANAFTTLTIHNMRNCNNAFQGLTGLTTLTIGNTCTAIPNNMFEGCSELTTVTFASGSTCISIGDNAFKGCTKLNNIKNNTTANTLPKTITTIGNKAFSGCSSLAKLNLNTGVITIGIEAFSGLTSLKELVIPNGVTTIGDNAFKGCTSIETLTIGEGVTTIGVDAFADAPLTTKLQYNAINCTNYNNAFTGKQIPSVGIGSNVTTIPENFIKGNKAVKKIGIPAKVTNIKADAFNNCTVANGIWIENKNCTIETTSTISKNTTVFVRLAASKAESSFTGVSDTGETFSTLMKWLYDNDKSYVPFSTKARDTANMNTVSQSEINTSSEKKQWVSTLGDYGYKVGKPGGPTGTPRKWLFGESYGETGIYKFTGYLVVPCVFSQRMICEGKAQGGATSTQFTAYEAGTYEFYYLLNGCMHSEWKLTVKLSGKDANGKAWSKSYDSDKNASVNPGNSGIQKGVVEFPSSGTYTVTFTATPTKAETSTDKEPVGVIVFGDAVRGPKREVICIDEVKDKKIKLGESSRTDEWGIDDVVSGSDFGNNKSEGFYYDGYTYDSCTEAKVTENGATVYRYFTSDKLMLTVDPAGGTWKGSTDKKAIALKEGATQEIPVPTRGGYNFIGWTLAGAGSKMTSLTGASTFTMGTENAKLTAKWEKTIIPITVGELEISKIGEYLVGTKTGENGTIQPIYEEKEMAGVEFEIYAKEDIYQEGNKGTKLYKKDQLVKSIVTNAQGKANLGDIAKGKYYIKESKTIEGFILNKEIKEFEIKSGGENIKIDYKNERQKINLNGKEGLKVEKIADKTVYKPGETVIYTIRVSNLLDYKIKDIKVEETMIEGKFEDIQTDNITKTGDKTIEIKELQPGEKVELKFIVEIAKDETTLQNLGTEKVKITNKIKAIGKVEKPSPDPDQPSIETTVEAEAEEEIYITNKKLVIVKEALKEEYQIGETAQYVIKIMNNGTESITKLLIEEQLLDGKFVYLEESSQNGVEIAGEGQKVAISKIRPGETVILRYEYQVTENTKVTLTESQEMILSNTVKGKGKIQIPDPENPDNKIEEEIEDESTEEIKVTELDKKYIGIIKKDCETGAVVEGATIGLYARDDIKDKQGNVIIAKDTLIEKSVTNQYGKAKYNVDLPLGRYYLKELEAPLGYILSEETVEIDGTYKGPEIEEISVSKTLGNMLKKEKKEVNFSVDKTLSSIMLNGQEIDITNNKLAKLEIKSSQINKTEIVAKYNIKVSNKGEVKGKVKVLETIPDGYEIVGASSARPMDWQENKDGTLQTEVELEVGESKDLSVTLRWTNDEKNLGLRTNRAQIEGDEDESNMEDNISEATIVLSIKTGEIVSIIIIGMIIIALAISGYITYVIIRKKGPDINKINFLNK